MSSNVHNLKKKILFLQPAQILAQNISTEQKKMTFRSWETISLSPALAQMQKKHQLMINLHILSNYF